MFDSAKGVKQPLPVRETLHAEKANGRQHDASPKDINNALHLAVALSLHRGGAIEVLVAADRVLCTVAAVEGISVTDPESPPL
jgi:hypothetical protein